MRRDEIKHRAASCLAHQRWEANAEILLDRLINVGAVAIDAESIETFPCVAPVAPMAHS
jgi:hypothetical protein